MTTTQTEDVPEGFIPLPMSETILGPHDPTQPVTPGRFLAEGETEEPGTPISEYEIGSNESHHVVHESTPPESMPTREMQRQIAAYLAKQAAKPRPMQTKFIGRNATPVIVASDGSMYLQPVKGGAYVRVAVDHQTGEAMRVIPWSKARRKAEKRKRSSRENRSHHQSL
jgi:hypothetical protein